MIKKVLLIIISIYINDLFGKLCDFNQSMDANSELYANKYSSVQMRNNIIFLKNLYEKNHPNKINKDKQRIPKIIHQIWVGPNPVPDIYKKWQQTWIKFHPGWQYFFWTDKEVSKLSLHNTDLYKKTKDYREKADLLRYELLYKFGGIYVDMDFECLKNFNDLLYYDFFVGIVDNSVDVILNNALIGTIPNHPILKKIISNVKSEEIEDWRWRSGVFYFSEQCMDLIKKDNQINIALPISFFYIIPYIYDAKESISKYIKPETMALHYWGNKLGMNK